MQSAEFEGFRARMAAMARLFGADLDGPLLDLYWIALRDWSLQDFEGAVAHLLTSAKFMPKPADFTELRKKAEEHSAAEACAKVFRLVAWGSAAERAELPPRALRVVELMGGWRALEMADTATRHFREKRFCELWDDASEVEQARAALPGAALKLSGPTKAFAQLERRP